MSERKYIIITSIFSPTEAIREFSRKKDWKLIVVGDKKTPKKWHHANVEFLSAPNQKNLGFKTYDLLPWNHYSRKMLGYLQAIRNGTEIIADTDDDNIPLHAWGKLDEENTHTIVTGSTYCNIYTLFTDSQTIWPRGYPLSQLLMRKKYTIKRKKVKTGIWQFLADEDPDVDAIYRLTNNTPIYFNKKTEPIVLEKGCLCPFNSQNTFFTKETFPLLYLPAYVNFRVTDILRSYVAQVILWTTDLKIGFGTATVIQKRNAHDYIKDFESEIPLYIHTEKIIDTLKKSVRENTSISKNLIYCYTGLCMAGFVQEKELELVHAWLADIEHLIVKK